MSFERRTYLINNEYIYWKLYKDINVEIDNTKFLFFNLHNLPCKILDIQYSIMHKKFSEIIFIDSKVYDL